MLRTRSVSTKEGLNWARNGRPRQGSWQSSSFEHPPRMGTALSLVGTRAIAASSGIARVRETIRSVYFLNNGLGSVLTVLPDGESVEVGLIGNEGFVGVPVIFGFKTSPLRIMIQSDATAYRVDAQSLRKILPDCPALEKQLQRFSMILGMQSTQLAACNLLHDVRRKTGQTAANEP